MTGRPPMVRPEASERGSRAIAAGRTGKRGGGVMDLEQPFQRLAENIPDILFRVRLDPELHFDYVSPSVRVLTGHRPESFYGSFTRALRILHPDDRGSFLDAVRDPAQMPVLTLRLLRTDRSPLWAEQRLVSIRDGRGKTLAVEGVLRDVTAHHRADERLAALGEIARAILGGQEAGETLRLIAHHAAALIDADQAMVLIEDGEHGVLEVAVADGIQAEHLPGARLGRPRLFSEVLRSGHSVIVDDLASIVPEVGPCLPARPAAAVITSLGGHDRSFGLLVVVLLTRRGLGELEQRVVESFAHQAAIAFEQGRARSAMDRLAVLEDRTRIARELHDGIVQGLFGVGMALRGIIANADDAAVVRRQLDREAQFVDRLIQDLRDYIFELHPKAISDGSLGEALALLARRFEERYGIAISADIEPQAAAGMERCASQMLQIAREALSNAGRHASAASCRLALRGEGGSIVLSIADDGGGIPEEVRRRGTRGGGLDNIRERARALGGRARVTSRQGKGTTVRIVLPAGEEE